MAFFHHGTIKKYVAALLDLFNGIEIQYNTSNGTITRSVPLTYSSKEKLTHLDNKTTEQLLSGNYNVLPRAALALSAIQKDETRIKNKNIKINVTKSPDTFEYMYNSVPYEFLFDLTVQCRGMSEACIIIEQIAPYFNPIYNLDIYEAPNLDEPTRVPVRLLDIAIETEEYEELSSNIVTVKFGLSIQGNMYPPIKTIDKIKEVKMSINEIKEDKAKRIIIDEWDVNDEGLLVDGISTQSYEYSTPEIIDITVDNFIMGDSTFTVIYNDKDNLIDDLTFNWEVIYPVSSVIVGNLDTAIVTASESGDYEIQVTITDPNGNYATLSKVFTI